MLKLALQSELPIIKVTTDDTVNVNAILNHILKENHPMDVFVEIHKDNMAKFQTSLEAFKSKFFFSISPPPMDLRTMYIRLVNADRVWVIVNPQDESDIMFDAGVVPVPDKFLKDFLGTMVEEEAMEPLIKVFGGMSLKDVGEIARMTMAQYGALTPRGVLKLRRQHMKKVSGVEQVDATMSQYYWPEEWLSEWLEVDGKIFLQDDAPEFLIPRGLLLKGPPGTGKTMAAKYIANNLGVPLFRLDIGSLLGKYVGESEGNMNKALAQVDQTEPCVFLIDEVEKLFQGGNDSGVTHRLLSTLLWWLQEHKSRVFTLMTTNDADILPEELWRPGRIDKAIQFSGMNKDIAVVFSYELLQSIANKGVQFDLDELQLQAKGYLNTLFNQGGKDDISHAETTQIVYRLLKKHLAGTI